MNWVYFYLGGVVALFCESLVQWMHPQETSANETLEDALEAALLWPIFAIIALAEFFKRIFQKT